jgi:hypothetical protein
MKVTIEFDGNEEQEEMQSAINGGKWKALVWDIDQELRKVVKYNSSVVDYSEPASIEEVDFADKLRKVIRELASDYGLIIE